MVALAHGTNDAQKTMGVISLALIANGSISGGDDFHVPDWVVVSCATAIALGTYAGGWRIIKTLGTKVVEVRPPQGFGSETVAASVILASSHVGFPLSTTQVVSGAVAGSGVGRPGAVVNWLVARNIVVGWLLTLPAAAAVGSACLRRHRRCSAAASSARSSSASRWSIGAFTALARQPRQAGRARGDGLRSSRPSARRPPRAGGGMIFAVAVDWGKLLRGGATCRPRSASA